MNLKSYQLQQHTDERPQVHPELGLAGWAQCKVKEAKEYAI